MTKRKPHNHHAGYVAMRRHPILKGSSAYVTIYDTTLLDTLDCRSAWVRHSVDIDTDGARYAVICDYHGIIVADTSLKGARASMKNPGNFCDACRAVGCPG